MGMHMVILYVPFLNQIFGIAPIYYKEWVLVLIFSFPVVIIDEVLKAYGRSRDRRNLKVEKSH
jgi:Ca2+-transporting ATPase